MKTYLNILFIIIPFTFSCYGQGTLNSKEIFDGVLYSPKELREELNYLFQRIEAIHINPYTVKLKYIS